jgi:hypothetical protein
MMNDSLLCNKKKQPNKHTHTENKQNCTQTQDKIYLSSFFHQTLNAWPRPCNFTIQNMIFQL